ncbi:MAG: penicillin-binding protein 2 [bacterium]|nr:penicillin-binding protein 2 [bacterium]
MKGSRFDVVIKGRINWVLLFFSAVLVILLAKIFMMQIVDHREYLSLAAKQHRLIKEIFPERGDIFMQDKKGLLIPLALNKIQKNLVVSPRDIKDSEAITELLSNDLGLDKDEVLKKISNTADAYEVLVKKLDDEVAKKLELKKIKGLFVEEEKRRIYPNLNLAAHAVGFVSKESEVEAGRYGLENFYERELSGKKGIFEGAKDAGGSWVALGRKIVNPPKDGASLVLTIDYNIQLKTEQILQDAQEKWKAAAVSALVMDPTSGKILALASQPSFDPNEFFKEKDYGIFVDPLVESMYELGSVIKPITMAAALNEGIIKPESTYNDEGTVSMAGYDINNADGKKHGVQTMTQVLEKSLNTGAVYVSKLLGKDLQWDYFKKFGFGSKTGVDLPGEISGNISNLNHGREIDFATASFGQGVAITPIQLATAMGAIANKGVLMRPYIVQKVIDNSGNETTYQPKISGEVISPETAETLTKMLVSVVKNGYDNRAGVKGYFVAGKTGTAQIPKKGQRGYSDDVVHAFVGYAPAFKPRFLVFLQLIKPQARFAATTLPEHFKELANFILNYYEVPPDEK